MQRREPRAQRLAVYPSIETQPQHTAVLATAHLRPRLRTVVHIVGNLVPEHHSAQAGLAVVETKEGLRQRHVVVHDHGVRLHRAYAPGAERPHFAVRGFEAADQGGAEPGERDAGEGVECPPADLLGVVVGQQLVGDVPGQRDGCRAVGRVQLRDPTGQRGIDEPGVHVEVAPVDAFQEHGVEQLEELVGGQGDPGQGQAQVRRKPRGGKSVTTGRTPGPVEIETHRAQPRKVAPRHDGDPGAVQATREADVHRGVTELARQSGAIAVELGADARCDGCDRQGLPGRHRALGAPGRVSLHRGCRRHRPDLLEATARLDQVTRPGREEQLPVGAACPEELVDPERIPHDLDAGRSPGHAGEGATRLRGERRVLIGRRGHDAPVRPPEVRVELAYEPEHAGRMAARCRMARPRSHMSREAVSASRK